MPEKRPNDKNLRQNDSLAESFQIILPYNYSAKNFQNFILRLQSYSHILKFDQTIILILSLL